MTPDALRHVWPGGEHDFLLGLGELRALQKNCDAGPNEVMARLSAGGWRVDDVYETLRLGLIGGGMASREAGPLVEKTVAQVRLLRLAPYALAVIGHSLIAPDPEDVPEKPAGAETAAENGGSPKSTAPAP